MKVWAGRYDVNLSANDELCAGATTPPALPCVGGNLLAGVDVTADRSLDLDLRPIAVTGVVHLNDGDLPGASYDRGAIQSSPSASRRRATTSTSARPPRRRRMRPRCCRAVTSRASAPRILLAARTCRERCRAFRRSWSAAARKQPRPDSPPASVARSCALSSTTHKRGDARGILGRRGRHHRLADRQRLLAAPTVTGAARAAQSSAGLRPARGRLCRCPARSGGRHLCSRRSPASRSSRRRRRAGRPPRRARRPRP